MSNAKHIPAPWYLKRINEHEMSVVYHYGANSEATPLAHVSSTNPEIVEANAKLIALAPEMFEVLEYLFHETRLEGCSEVINNKIVAILTKVKG